MGALSLNERGEAVDVATRRATWLMKTVRASGLLLVAWMVTGAGAPPKVVLGDGTLYVGAYTGDILAIDEATEKVASIHLTTGVPYQVQVSSDATRLYALNWDMEHFEVVDVEKKQSVDTFALSEPGAKVRVRGYAVDPQQHFMAVGIQPVKKLIDRFEIEPTQLVLYDLTTHQVVKTVPPPDGPGTTRFNLRFSPDGKLLYVFGRDILILDASTLAQVDHWDMSLPIEPGMGSGSLGSQEDAYRGSGLLHGPVHGPGSRCEQANRGRGTN